MTPEWLLPAQQSFTSSIWLILAIACVVWCLMVLRVAGFQPHAIFYRVAAFFKKIRQTATKGEN